MKYKYFGKVFKIPFPFTDLSGKKSRPALAVSEPDELSDIEFLFITTKTTRGFDRIVPIHQQDYSDKGLPFESIVHIGKPYLLNTSIIGKYLCQMTEKFMEKVLRELTHKETTRFYNYFHAPLHSKTACAFPTTVNPIIQNNLIPVFLDVELGTYNIQADQIEAALSEKTGAIFPAHTLGNPFNLGKVMELAEKYTLWVIEDNCDALGSKYNGRYTGTFGHIATFSFYPAHHITMGEGGAVTTNDDQLKRLIESFRDWGRDCWCASGKDNSCGKRFGWQLGELPPGYDHKYIYSHIGYNLKITDMQAAIGCAQLEKLPSFMEARKRNWRMLREGLADLSDFFILPEPTPNSDPSWFGFILTIKDKAKFSRDDIVRYLEEKGIQTRMLFAGNILKHPCFDEMRKNGAGFRVAGNLPNTDKIMRDTFWLGVYPGITEEKLEYMIEEIRNFVKSHE